uniref:Uncharacterized protein n=1 Tax=Cacopsylla melanoneura TaxID=428564 RepID=A0A8D8ZVA9_9HEMI
MVDRATLGCRDTKVFPVYQASLAPKETKAIGVKRVYRAPRELKDRRESRAKTGTEAYPGPQDSRDPQDHRKHKLMILAGSPVQYLTLVPFRAYLEPRVPREWMEHRD